MLYIFNYSLQSHEIPEQWKTAIISPIFKKGDRSKPENHRPVSLTSSFSRIFESIVSEKMLSYLLGNGILTQYQFGFVPGKSTCSHLLSSLYHWVKSFASNKATTVLYTDLSKAFDCVIHTKLIALLNVYGINAALINWIENFLSGRVQQVSINDQLSKLLPVKSGVPQGSVIGPLLFIIYVNDIVKTAVPIEPDGGIRLFADDAKLFSTNVENLQTSVNLFTSWVKSRQLMLAKSKCFQLKICRRNHEMVPDITIDDTTIESTSVVKDLGVVMSKNLKWGPQIDRVYRTASLTSYQILKAFKTKNIWIFKKLYVTYIRPKCEYNTSVWSPYLLKDIHKIERIQKRFTKIACIKCNIPFKDYQDRLYKIGLKTLQHRRIIIDLILLYKIINGLSDLRFDQYFKFRTNPYGLRGNSRTIITIFSSKVTEWHNCFFARSARYWNFLPNNVVCSKNLNLFKFTLSNVDISPLQ